MGWLGRVSRGLGVLALLTACSSSGEQTARPKPVRSAPKLGEAAKRVKADSPYDAQGTLKPSGERLAWLELPMAFANTKMSRPQHHVYVGREPVSALTRFFDARVFTSDLNVAGRGIVYRAAGPKSMDPNAQRFDISIHPTTGSDEVRLVIDELPGAGSKAVTMQAAKSLLAEEQARAE